MTPDLFEQLLKLATDHTAGSWSAVAIFVVMTAGTLLSNRKRPAHGVPPPQAADPLRDDMWRRIKELDEDKDDIRHEIDRVKAAMNEALERAADKLAERDKRIAQLCGEVNEQLRLRSLPDRYDALGERILITPILGH